MDADTAARFDLSGRTALVTGASSGLGAHFARVLAGAGARVALAARRMDRLEALRGELAGAGTDALAVSMEVGDAASVTAAFDRLEAEGFAPDILVNNAGISREGWFTEMSEEDWQAVIDVNLTGAWRVAKRFCADLKARGEPGALVNTASITALRPSHTIAAYAASKAGLEHLTRIMALEMARYGVRVNALAPGYFKTEINDAFLESEEGAKLVRRVPLRRYGDHAELSGPLLLLCSDAGSFMTGATMVIDGGHVLSPL